MKYHRIDFHKGYHLKFMNITYPKFSYLGTLERFFFLTGNDFLACRFNVTRQTEIGTLTFIEVLTVDSPYHS